MCYSQSAVSISEVHHGDAESADDVEGRFIFLLNNQFNTNYFNCLFRNYFVCVAGFSFTGIILFGTPMSTTDPEERLHDRSSWRHEAAQNGGEKAAQRAYNVGHAAAKNCKVRILF